MTQDELQCDRTRPVSSDSPILASPNSVLSLQHLESSWLAMQQRVSSKNSWQKGLLSSPRTIQWCRISCDHRILTMSSNSSSQPICAAGSTRASRRSLGYIPRERTECTIPVRLSILITTVVRVESRFIFGKIYDTIE